MNDLDRIDRALGENQLNHDTFERCALDLLSPVFPGLTPIPGGTDWGRDGDVATPGDEPPIRVLATRSRTPKGVGDNLRRGLRSMQAHGEPFDRIVLANPASLTLRQRQSLAKSASQFGARLDVSNIFDRGFFASRLRRDGYWRNQLLGLSSEPIALSRTAPELADAGTAAIPLLGRDDDVAVLAGDDDVVLFGVPGVGKSRVAQELDDVVFVDKLAPFDEIAAGLRWAVPRNVVVDDAAEGEDVVKRLVALRRSEDDLLRYRVVLLCWPQDADRVRDWLPGARPQELGLLEAGTLNDLLLNLGITSVLARGEILRQAEGRPGWLVALATLLLNAGHGEEILDGNALWGEVSRYFRRAGFDDALTDLVATVAALGFVDDVDLDRLAEHRGLLRSALINQLNGVARSGMVDVVSYYSLERGMNIQRYQIRPPMLASVLVAERGFGTPVAPLALDRELTTRVGVLGAALAAGMESPLKDAACAAVAPADLTLMESLWVRKEVDVGVWKTLLTHREAVVRVVAALAIAYDLEIATPPPDELLGVWLSAIENWEPSLVPIAGHRAATMMRWLWDTAEDVAWSILVRALDTPNDESYYSRLPHDLWESISGIPRDRKTALLLRYRENDHLMWLLSREIAGDDVEWVAEMIDQGLLSAAAAVDCFRSLDARPPIDRIAEALVPRGVAPEAVAGILASGTWWGEESARYAGFIEMFAGLQQSDSGPVRAVATAGIEMYTRLRGESLEKERIERIRGYR